MSIIPKIIYVLQIIYDYLQFLLSCFSLVVNIKLNLKTNDSIQIVYKYEPNKILLCYKIIIRVQIKFRLPGAGILYSNFAYIRGMSNISIITRNELKNKCGIVLNNI